MVMQTSLFVYNMKHTLFSICLFRIFCIVIIDYREIISCVLLGHRICNMEYIVWNTNLVHFHEKICYTHFLYIICT